MRLYERLWTHIPEIARNTVRDVSASRENRKNFCKNNTLTGRSEIREVYNGVQRTRDKTHTL